MKEKNKGLPEKTNGTRAKEEKAKAKRRNERCR